jgi:hypothetical protein
MSGGGNLEIRIREKAYSLWLKDGCVQGKQDEHWERARVEIEEKDGVVIKADPLPQV